MSRKNWLKMGLRFRIVVPTILVFAVCMTLSTWLTVSTSLRGVEDSTGNQLNEMAEMMSKSVSGWIGERQEDIAGLSEMPIFQALVSIPRPAASDLSIAGDRLMRIKKTSRQYELLGIADPTGQVICSSDAEQSQKVSVTDRDYFVRAIKGESCISEIIRSRVTGNPSIVVAAPIKNEKGPQAVIFGALDMKSFTRRFVEPVKIGANGYIFVTDHLGTFCSHPDPTVVLTSSLSKFEWTKEIFAKKNGFLRYEYQGQDVMAAYRTDAIYGWIVVVRALADEIMASSLKIRDINVATGIISVMLAVLVLLRVSRSITKPIEELVDVSELIADGNLTAAKGRTQDLRELMDRRDETGVLLDSMAKMTLRLDALVSQVRRSSLELVSTAGEISAATQQQESVTNDFHASATQVFAAVKEITATAQELSRSMGRVKEVGEDSAKRAVTGRTGLLEMDRSIHQLVEASVSISEKLTEINAKADKIANVVTTMTKVADQTNLLSLNAAIEAEKAGEYGQGFSVVAAEIRHLADQTAVATLDIERQVKDMRFAVSAGVSETGRFSEEVNRSVRTVSEVSQHLSRIIETTQEVAPQFESVTEGMQAQVEGARQIGTALALLTEGAEGTTESLKKLNETTRRLREWSGQLQSQVSEFQV